MDYYTLLGLAPGASVSEVKRAYRRLSRRYHPGINPGDRQAEAVFRRITEAYETLVDVDRRRQYDAAGVVVAPARDRTFEFTGFDFSVKAHGAQAATFSELFAEALHPVPSPERNRPEAGADLHATLSVTFIEAMRGVDRQLTVTRQVTCGTCRGTGHVHTAESPCRQCRGSGQMRWARGHMIFTKACAGCGGTGRERHQRCLVCAGQGRSVRTEGLTVRVPAGVVDAMQLRVAERGHAGSQGGRPGDLFVDIAVQPHPVLRRDRDDLHMVVPIAVHEAALGARIEVSSFDGPVRLKIPPGAQGAQRFRVSERGAPSLSGRRGDLWIEVRISMPPIMDERSKELMREFARLHPGDVRRELVELLDSQGLS